MRFWFFLVSTLYVLALVVYIWFLIHTIASTRKGRIIFVRSNVREIAAGLREIVKKYVRDTKKVEFVEAGAGLSNVSRFMAKQFTWKNMQAIEISGGLVMVSRLLNRCAQAPIRIIKKNIFSVEYPKGAVIYSYLSTEIINRLYTEKKLDGCLFISLTFALTDVEPTEEMTLAHWQKRLLVYDFRIFP